MMQEKNLMLGKRQRNSGDTTATGMLKLGLREPVTRSICKRKTLKNVKIFEHQSKQRFQSKSTDLLLFRKKIPA